jgi:hypothetical protein
VGLEENDDKGPTQESEAQQENNVIKNVVEQIHPIPPNRLGQPNHGQDLD